MLCISSSNIVLDGKQSKNMSDNWYYIYQTSAGVGGQAKEADSVSVSISVVWQILDHWVEKKS